MSYISVNKMAIRSILAFLTVFFICANIYAVEKSVLLTVKPVDDTFFDYTEQGADPSMKLNPDQRIVVGLINVPSFEIKNTANTALYDSEGRQIPITIDKSSFYSEFDDSTINSMRISFITDDRTIKKGHFRFEWGDNINSKNTVVDKIPVFTTSKDIYREFTWEEQPQKSDLANYSATLDIIVDDKADTYYLWYLLPMVLIFFMLIIRRLFPA